MSPVSKTSAYEVVQVQLPMFFKRQVFVKAAPGAKGVPSGTVTSAMNWAQSHVEKAEAFCVGMVAAGAKDINTAATIIINLAENLDFMTFSFILAKNSIDPYGRRVNLPKVPI